MQKKQTVLRRCTEFFEAAEESGLGLFALEDLFAPLYKAIDDYYNDDLSKPVQDAITALSHGLLREGFTYDRPVNYKPCGNPPLGWEDVTALFEKEDEFCAIDVETFVGSIVEVQPTNTDPNQPPEDAYYQSDIVDYWVNKFTVYKALNRSSLKFIAEHGNATHIIPGAEMMYGGAVLLSAPSADDLKNDIFKVRKYADLIECRGLSVKVY